MVAAYSRIHRTCAVLPACALGQRIWYDYTVRIWYLSSRSGTVPPQWDARRGVQRDHDREQAIKLTRLPEKLYHVCSSFENGYTAPLKADPNCISGFSTFTMMAYDLSDSVNVVLYK